MGNEKGQSLVEAILALSMAVIIITAVVSAVTSSLNNSSSSKNQNLASTLAQEGLDNMRNYKTQYFNELKNNFSGSFCLEEATPSGTTNNDGNTCNKIAAGGTSDLVFKRYVYLNHQGKDGRPSPTINACSISPSTFVAVTVVWTDSKCKVNTDCHKVELTSCFVNANVLPAP